MLNMETSKRKRTSDNILSGVNPLLNAPSGCTAMSDCIHGSLTMESESRYIVAVIDNSIEDDVPDVTPEKYQMEYDDLDEAINAMMDAWNEVYDGTQEELRGEVFACDGEDDVYSLYITYDGKTYM